MYIYRKSFWVLVLLFVCGCKGADSGLQSAAGPTLVVLDTIQLRQSDTLYIGRPRDLALDPGDGTFYISDTFYDRVVRFDRRGRPLQVYGRRGKGPGELSIVGISFVLDSMLFVADNGQSRLNVYNRRTGAFQRQLSYEGFLASAFPGRDNDRAWFGLVSMERQTGVMVWNAARGTDSLVYLIPFPPSYIQFPPLARIYPGVSVVAWSDTLLVGFMATNTLRVFTEAGIALDTLTIPVVRRRGIAENSAEKMPALSPRERIALNSALFESHRLPTGRFALVHYDHKVTENGNITSTIFLTLLSQDLERACVDGRVPIHGAGIPFVAFRGDTLFAVQQKVAQGRAVTFVKSFKIDDTSCDWLPTGL